MSRGSDVRGKDVVWEPGAPHYDRHAVSGSEGEAWAELRCTTSHTWYLPQALVLASGRFRGSQSTGDRFRGELQASDICHESDTPAPVC